MAKHNEEIAKKIEHTLLKSDALEGDIKALCEEAQANNFFGVCVPPYYIHKAKLFLANSDVKIISVVGFPMGYTSTSAKVEEVKKAVNDGVDELDMVINIAALKNNDFKFLRNDIDSVLTAARWSNKVLKVIIESAALSDEEIEKACALCAELQVDFVKTSTGLHPAGGASEKAVALMRELLPKSIKIKASGGIKDAAFANKLIAAGADRIGTSSGLKIIGK
ncbi:MAG: deoxyribose-phosphate aldolase [Chitinophagales bacterium]